MIVLIILLLILTLLFSNTKEPFTLYQGFEYSDKLSIQDIQHLKQGQTIMTQMLDAFDTICRQHHITYFIWAGNLLGSQLYQGWIPWDGDLDVYVLESDYPKLEKLLINYPPKDTWYQTLKTDPHYQRPSGNQSPLPKGKLRHLYSCYLKCQDQTLWHNGFQLDINLFKTKNDRILFDQPFDAERRIQQKITIHDIFPLQQVPYDGLKVFAPRNPQKILNYHYKGKWRRPVPISKRYPHEGLLRTNLVCPHHYTLYPHLYK